MHAIIQTRKAVWGGPDPVSTRLLSCIGRNAREILKAHVWSGPSPVSIGMLTFRRVCTVKYEVYFFKSRYRLTCVFYEGFLMRHRFCTVKYDADPRGGSLLTSLGLPWGSFGDFCSYRATTVFYGVGSWRGHPAGRVGRVLILTYLTLESAFIE